MKTILTKAFKYRLKPNAHQRVLFAHYAGCARYVYNDALARCVDALKDGHAPPTYEDAAGRLPFMKASEDTAFLSDVHSQVLQQSLMICHRAITRSKKDKRTGFPRFKRKGRSESFKFPQGIKVCDSQVRLPRIGSVNFRNSRPVEGKIKQAVIKQEGEHWYLTLFTKVEADIAKVPVIDEEAIGIDVGLSSFVTLSTGKKVKSPKYLKKYLDELRILYRALSRKKKYSNNWKKGVIKIQDLHRRIKNLREDFLHKLSTLLSKNHGVVCAETLGIKDMMQNGMLARSIADAGWGIFLRFIEYKCEWLGKHFVKAPRRFPSSKLCSKCGNKQDMPLHIREYDCSACDLKLDRDINASINLRVAGLSILKTCGANDLSLRTEAGIHGF